MTNDDMVKLNLKGGYRTVMEMLKVSLCRVTCSVYAVGLKYFYKNNMLIKELQIFDKTS